MQYNLIRFGAGVDLLQEIHQGTVLRYCTLEGVTQEPPLGDARFVEEHTPKFPVPVAPRFVQEDVAPLEVPAAITRLQAKLVLAQYGLLEPVKEFVAGADVVTKLAWENAAEFERESALVLSVAKAIGLEGPELDKMFLDGALIKV